VPLQPVEFNGLAALTADELVGISEAIDASDCVVDDGTVRGRSGYRNALGSGTAVDSSGTPQGVFRHHASPTQYRTVVASGGKLYQVTDPAGESSNGSAGAGTTKFGATDNICAAQLGRYLYVGSDALNPSDSEPWPLVRVTATGTYETVTVLPQGAKPTLQSKSSMSVVRFQNKTRTVTGARSFTKFSGSNEAYYYDHNNNAGMLQNDSVSVTISATSENWTSYSHIVLLACPGYYGKMGSVPISVSIGDDTSPTTVWSALGELHDASWNTTGLAPDVWVFDLSAIPSAVLDSVKYLKFEANDSAQRGQTLLITGYMLVAQSPGAGTFQYRTTFYTSGTDAESMPTETLDVVFSEPLNNQFPLTVAAQLNSANEPWFRSIYVDPNNLPARVGNYATGIAMPPRTIYCGAATIRQAIPTSIQSAGTCRLWRWTDTGWRLVKTPTPWTGTTTTLDTLDDQGSRVLANQKWDATGSYSRASAMSARDGRLILGYENRIYISGFVGPGETSDPYPQFPPVAVDEPDGWAFDIAPSTKEQIKAIVNGDQLYVGTTEAVYAMDEIKPNSPFQAIMRRGVISRRGMVFVEDLCIWAARDGVYAVQGRVNAGWDSRTPTEMTMQVRRIYLDWLVPTSATVLAYRERKLFVIVGTRFMRYDFVRRAWTRGTFAHTMVDAEEWLDPTTQAEQCWLLTDGRRLQRVQNGLTTDDATAVPSWTYRTGYVRSDKRMRLARVVVDPTGEVVLTAYKGSNANADVRSATVTNRTDAVEVEAPMPSDVGAYKWGFRLAAANSVQVRALFVNVEGIEGAGG
jgi:hypothetical protein